MIERHRRFCEEYVKDFNGAAAARRAGYEELGDRVQACNLLQREDVQGYLNQLISEIRKRNQLEVDDLVQELKRVAFSDIGNYFDEDCNILPIHEIAQEARSALTHYQEDEHPSRHGIKRVRRIKLHSKLDAIEKLMRYMGAYELDNRQSSGHDLASRSTLDLEEELASIRRMRGSFGEEE